MTDHVNGVQIGAHGRVVIPAPLRKSMGLKQGDYLIARKEGDRIILERREAIERRLLARLDHIPEEINLTDELIAERRAAYTREHKG